MMDVDAVLARHERIALQFSGGRDSLAVLWLMKPYWGRLTVYWCNTGDAYPETMSLMNYYAAILPRFVEIDGKVGDVIAQFGIPSDVVPATNTETGLAMGGGAGPLIQDRYHCCARTMMLPTHERMIRDRITLIIRGQRASDAIKATTKSGQVIDGFELLYPIEHWTAQQVNDYLMSQNVALPSYYATMDSMPDCMGCSAFWQTGQAAYRSANHPQAHVIAQGRLDAINDAMREHIIAFNREVSA